MVLKQTDCRHHRRHFPKPGLVGSEHVAQMELRFAFPANPGQELLRVFDLFGFLHDPECCEGIADQQLSQGYRDVYDLTLDLAGQSRLIRAVIDRVGYDGRTGKIAVTFRSGGFKAICALSEEVPT